MLILIVFLGLISFTWLNPDSNFIPLGHGISIDGLRSYFIFLIGFITLAANAIKLKKNDLSSEMLIYAMFILWATSSIFWSISLSYSVRDSIKLWYPLCIYLITRIHIKNLGSALWLEKKIFQAIGILILISGGLALASIAFGWNTTMSSNTEIDRITDSSNVYSIGMGGLVIFIIHNCIISRQKGWKYILLNYKIWFPAVIIFVTITRSYIISAICASVSALFISKKVTYTRLLLCILFIFLIGFSIVIFVEPIKARMFWDPNDVSISTIFKNPTLFFDSNYIRSSGRFTIWSYYINKLHSYVSPLIGGGLGTVRYILSGGSIFGIATPHGEYSKYLAELGYFGLGFYIFCLVLFVNAIFLKAMKTNSAFIRRQYILALSCFIYIGICGVGYTPFYNSVGFIEIIFIFVAMGDSLYKKQYAQIDSQVYASYRRFPSNQKAFFIS